ncbi:MAG: PilT/PilU family type 4a pilus ATPase [Planctomycetes bacterium]|nr:PilT/PilU family type 4a pilus ATPase [Planctomycetota bacterium]
MDQHDQHGRRSEPTLNKFFKALVKTAASDLHFKAGSPPHIRIRGSLSPANSPALDGEQIEKMALELLTEKQKVYLEIHGSIDVAHDLPGSDRFRINIYRQRGELSIAARRVSRDIPDFEKLHLPAVLGEITQHHQGLVLLAGITGCGKSTTIASMLEYINRGRACHIVTIEDPIEFIYTDKKALVNQREIGIDVENFESALKYLMREDPDVILIGEMRDRETFQAALQAAETGHLVFGTVHASTSGQTIGRILDLFDPESRDLVRQSLAYNLQAIVCQKLLPCLDKRIGRIPVVEVMLANPSVQKFITEGRESDLIDVIRGSEGEGMVDFNKSLLALIEKEMIDPHSAYSVSPNPEELKMLMKGISTSHGGLIGR